MAISVILPRQGQSVESCIITEWYKRKGDKVAVGDLLFAYETDKSSFEEESQAEGILLEIYCGEGEEVPVLTEVALIGEEGEKIEHAEISKSVSEPEEESTPVEQETASAAKPVEESGPVQEEQRIRISPRAKKMAETRGVQFDKIRGSGPNGRIIVRDIESAESIQAEAPSAEKVPPASPPKAAPATAPANEAVASGDYEEKPLSNMRKLIAGAMHASLQNSAQLTHHLSADARSILSLRKKMKKLQAEGDRRNITLNDMICFSVIKALKKHPDANAHFLGESIRYFNRVHLGIAVDTDRGLMVPVLQNADELSLSGLSSQMARLASACRTGNIDPDLLQPEAASFTVSNLGNYGVEMFTPVINLPQAGILGVNTIIERPARMEDGTFGFVPYLGLSLTYDHRALDGGPATLFLAGIKKEIEQFSHDLINQS